MLKRTPQIQGMVGKSLKVFSSICKHSYAFETVIFYNNFLKLNSICWNCHTQINACKSPENSSGWKYISPRL